MESEYSSKEQAGSARYWKTSRGVEGAVKKCWEKTCEKTEGTWMLEEERKQGQKSITPTYWNPPPVQDAQVQWLLNPVSYIWDAEVQNDNVYIIITLL